MRLLSPILALALTFTLAASGFAADAELPRQPMFGAHLDARDGSMSATALRIGRP